MAEMSFDTALEKLEKIVEQLEGGHLTLEESLALFEEGVRLSSLCQKELKKTEGKVQRLVQKLDGDLELVEMGE
jgi:exodeoxyribonuclease VII small subunit